MVDNNELFEEILLELSYRSDEGYPDFSKPQHITILSEILTDWGMTDVKYELIKNLLKEDEKEDEKYFGIGPGTYVKKTDLTPDNKPKADAQRFTKDDSGNYKPVEDDEKGKTTTDPTKLTSKDYNYTKKGNQQNQSKQKETREQKLKRLEKLTPEERSKIDHNSADKSLMMTKTEAKAQAKRTKEGEKQNVGAGTAESRAGEAMVHKGLRLIQEGKSLDEIEAEFNKLVNSDDHILNSKTGKKWVGATISSIKKIEETIGTENIETVAWDTDAGRMAIGVDPDLETSSDMFVRTKDGKNLGLSLKKDGNVFLNNGGWAKQSKILLGDLKEQMGEESHTRLSEAMSIEAYDDDLTDRFKFVGGTITEDVIREDFERLKNDEAMIKKYFGGSNQPTYFRILENPKALYERMVNGTMSKNDQKVVAKLTQAYHKEEYDHLRESEGALTQRTFDVLNSDMEAKNGMNKHIIKSMHISETLGLNQRVKEGGVDGFQTMYGIEPDGAVLNEQTLVSLFGSNFQSMLQEQIQEVRDGNKEYSELEQFISDSIEIDYESGQILFKHESNKKFPLFKLQGRARGIGASPTMEMLQTPFMAHALKMGTFNTDEWDEKSLERFEKDIEEVESD